MFDTAATMLSVCLCCCAVKLTDDFLDRDVDCSGGRANWAVRLGPGAMVYAVLLLALAAGFCPRVSLSLFFASYCIGMFNDLTVLLPSRLKGWQESLLVLTLGVILFDWRTVVFALLFVASVQCFDDCVDMRSDRLCGQRNLACRFGPVVCLTGGLILLFSAWGLDEELFFPVCGGTVIFYFLAHRLAGRIL
ncbi:MAG: hypothetical protein P4N41_17285 [Negativicutes bacterium]|nr:hypothetical protein [Negativicutes bacterium]